MSEIDRIKAPIVREMKSFDVAEGGEKYYVADLPKGMYLIQLLGKSSKIIKTQRLSKR